MHDPFHPGERAIQERTGQRDLALVNGQLITDRVPAAAERFVAQQRYCAIGGSSAEGDLWAALLAGPPGFARTAEDRATLCLRLIDDLGVLSRIAPIAGLREGDHLGTLFIELGTRRRLRVNGRVTRFADDEIAVAITQAQPLCPKYIQRRQLEEREPSPAMTEIQAGESLTEALVAWITGADTFFVASAHPEGPADVSHRGGRPGFVRHRDGVLRIPDYPGNSLFSTLGNFAADPRAGLAFVDFETNRQLQLTGDVRLDLAAGVQAGSTGRWWEFTPRAWTVSPLNQALAWRFIDASPFNP